MGEAYRNGYFPYLIHDHDPALLSNRELCTRTTIFVQSRDS
jgi:hypothetical protein